MKYEPIALCPAPQGLIAHSYAENDLGIKRDFSDPVIAIALCKIYEVINGHQVPGLNTVCGISASDEGLHLCEEDEGFEGYSIGKKHWVKPQHVGDEK